MQVQIAIAVHASQVSAMGNLEEAKTIVMLNLEEAPYGGFPSSGTHPSYLWIRPPGNCHSSVALTRLDITIVCK
jgi:hypothetical protein